MTSAMFDYKLVALSVPTTSGLVAKAKKGRRRKKMSFTSKRETTSHGIVVVGIELVSERVNQRVSM
jgi:hypothetical protein